MTNTSKVMKKVAIKGPMNAFMISMSSFLIIDIEKQKNDSLLFLNYGQ
jgi:hypothetical protein